MTTRFVYLNWTHFELFKALFRYEKWVLSDVDEKFAEVQAQAEQIIISNLKHIFGW